MSLIELITYIEREKGVNTFIKADFYKFFEKAHQLDGSLEENKLYKSKLIELLEIRKKKMVLLANTSIFTMLESFMEELGNMLDFEKKLFLQIRQNTLDFYRALLSSREDIGDYPFLSKFYFSDFFREKYFELFGIESLMGDSPEMDFYLKEKPEGVGERILYLPILKTEFFYPYINHVRSLNGQERLINVNKFGLGEVFFSLDAFVDRLGVKIHEGVVYSDKFPLNKAILMYNQYDSAMEKLQKENQINLELLSELEISKNYLKKLLMLFREGCPKSAIMELDNFWNEFISEVSRLLLIYGVPEYTQQLLNIQR